MSKREREELEVSLSKYCAGGPCPFGLEIKLQETNFAEATEIFGLCDLWFKSFNSENRSSEKISPKIA